MSQGLIKYMKNLIVELGEELDYWQIVDVVDIEEIIENGKVYCKIKGDEIDRLYKKQGNEFIVQWTGYCEDDYSGYILKPINKTGKYLKISFNC